MVFRALPAGARRLGRPPCRHPWHGRAVGRGQPGRRSVPPPPRGGAGRRHRRGGARSGGAGGGRRGRSLAREAGAGAGIAQKGPRHQGLSLRTAVVRDHRPARGRQDDGAVQCRAQISARRRARPAAARRRRRHAAVRMAVRRRGGADRHRRALYDAGFRRRRRPRRLGSLSRSAEAHAPAAAAERRHRRDRDPRHRRGAARRAPRPCPRDPPPHPGAGRQVRAPPAGLCAVHKGRSDRRLHRILRRSRPRPARPGLGRHLSARRGRRLAACRLHRRIRGAGRASEPAPVRSPAGRAQPRSPRPDRRVSGPVRRPWRRARRVYGRGLRRLPPRAGAAAARLLSDLRHPGGHADRSADRLSGTLLRHRPAAHRKPAARARAQLFPCPPAQGGDLRRGDAGRAAARRRPPSPGAAGRRLRRGRARRARRQLGEASAALAGYEAAYRKIAAVLPPHPVADGDLPRLLPLLDKARALPWGYDSRRPAGSPGWRLPGLSPQRELAAGARAIYRHALERVLLPRLIWRLEAEMRGNLERPEFLYQATRVYLMLGAQGPLDRDVVRQWMAADWEAAYPDPSGQVQRDLLRHLDALLAAPLPAVPLDPELIAKARAIISRVPLASRIYSRIAAVARTVPPWRPADVLGPAGRALFVRASGKKLSEGIPGFYTVDGFYGALLPALGKLTREEASESWVVGKQAGAGSPDVPALERDVIALYEADYAKHWDALLADLDLVRLRTAQEGAQDLFVLASPQSPLRALLVALARQLTLTRKPAGKAPASPAPPPSLQGLFARPEPPGEEIDKRYRALREFVGGGPGAPIDQTLQAIDRLGRQLAQLASAPPGTPPAPPSGEDPVLLLRAAMMQAPQPVARWIGTIIADAVAIRGGSAAAGLKKAFNAGDGPAALCREAVRGRYPFSPEASEDIPLDDFIKLFSPGGLLNGFFNTELKPYVDTSGRVWRGRPVDGVAPPVSPAALAAFQRAATIRDVFFGAGGNMPSVRFDVIPISLDAGAKQVTLELGGTTIRYAHGPAPATQILWPGPSGIDNAKLAFDPPPQGGGGLLQASGPWALFRLFDQGRLTEAGSPERYRLTFTLGERQAVFELRAGSVLNPFARGLLQGFRCPSL